MAYLEQLPDQCPPAAAQDQAFGPAYRILPAAVPAVQHFYSHRQLGLGKPPTVDDCRFASCSLFTCPDKARAIARLPKKRAVSTHLAELTVGQGAGASYINQTTKHVDFWMYANFNVVAAVTQVIPL